MSAGGSNETCWLQHPVCRGQRFVARTRAELLLGHKENICHVWREGTCTLPIWKPPCRTGSLGYEVKATRWLVREENASQIRNEKACVPGSCLGVRESRGCSVAGCCQWCMAGAAQGSGVVLPPPLPYLQPRAAAQTCGGAGGDVPSSGEVFETLSTLFKLLSLRWRIVSWLVLAEQSLISYIF